MATRAVLTPAEEQQLYPVHEEDNVPETSPHEFAVRYARDVLGALFPESLVTGDICIYWIRGNRRRYVAAEAMVVRGRPREPLPRTYLLWREPPVSFVLEIGSDRTRRIDLEEKPEIYAQHIRAEEYLYADPPDPETPQREIFLWRLGPQGYLPVAMEASGRLRSQVLEVEFGFDAAGMLRIYVEGVPQPTHEEERQLRREAELLAQAEAMGRKEAEARAADLERQLAELRARLPSE